VSAAGGLTRAQAAKHRRELDRQRARHLKHQAREKVRSLAQAIKNAREARKHAIVDARARCKRERLAVRENLKEARAELVRQSRALREHGKAARHAARSACSSSKTAARSLSPIERARALLEAERSYQRELKLLEAHARERARGVSKSRPGLARARRSESDDEVRANIPPELFHLFDRVKGKIRASERASRTENFLKYAEEHPREVVNAIEDVSEHKIRELERRHREAQRFARKGRYTAAELADVPF
jgi:ribosomal protein L7/L12